MKSAIFAILGGLLGIPLSYYFQPGIVQAKLSLPEYVKHVPEIFSDQSGDYLAPLLLSVALCAILGGVLGWFMDQATLKNQKASAQL